jgi:CO/xanthine dehydrogenase FAD-binding subunit
LLTFEAEVELVSTNGARWVAYRDFHTGYKTTLRRREELIRAVRLPRATAGWRQYMRKVGARKAQAISKVCLAGLALLEGTTLIDIRLAYGSVAPVPWRAVQTEAILRGCAVDDAAALQRARAALAAELRPIDDVRSTAVYRTQVAGNLLEEMWLGLR